MTSIVYPIVAFLLFCYFEKVFESPFYVTVALAIYQYSTNKHKVGFLVSLGHLYLYNFGWKYVGVGLFIGYIAYLFQFDGLVEPASAAYVIHWRPYEREVRNYLFENDPSLLHLVDSLLDEYRGEEKNLLNDIKKGRISYQNRQEHNIGKDNRVRGSMISSSATHAAAPSSPSTLSPPSSSSSSFSPSFLKPSSQYSANSKIFARAQSKYTSSVTQTETQLPGDSGGTTGRQSHSNCDRPRPFESEIRLMLEQHRPQDLASLDALYKAYAGCENQLYEELRHRYASDKRSGIITPDTADSADHGSSSSGGSHRECREALSDGARVSEWNSVHRSRFDSPLEYKLSLVRRAAMPATVLSSMWSRLVSIVVGVYLFFYSSVVVVSQMALAPLRWIGVLTKLD